MAILTFGNTARTHDSITFKNTTSTNLVFALLRSDVIPPNGSKSLLFSDFDARLRGVNIHHNMLYAVNSDGKSPYLDDVAELCKLITTGQVAVYTASSVASAAGTFTTGSQLATSFIGGDGSVVFS